MGIRFLVQFACPHTTEVECKGVMRVRKVEPYNRRKESRKNESKDIVQLVDNA